MFFQTWERTGFLAHEIIGRKAQDDKSLVLVLLIHVLEAVVLGRVATLGRGIHHQDNLAFIGFTQVNLIFGSELAKILVQQITVASERRQADQGGHKGE
jgi:hypothetical protein